MNQISQVARQRKSGPDRKWTDMAIAYVLKYGFSELSLTAMAKELGVTKQALNYQFGSRDQLLKLMIDTFQVEIFQDADRLREEARSVEEMISMMCQWAWENRERHQVWFEMLILSTRKPELFVGFGQRSRDFWFGLFEERFRAEGCPQSQLVPLLDLLMNQFNGVIFDQLVRNDPDRMFAATSLFIEMYRNQKAQWSPCAQ